MIEAQRSAPSKSSASFYLFGTSGHSLDPIPDGVVVCRSDQVSQVLLQAKAKDVLICFDRTSADALLKASLGAGPRTQLAQLLTIEPPRAQSVPALVGVFGLVLGLGADYRWLPVEELVRVLAGSDPTSRFIGGASDLEMATLTLIRGDRQSMVLPFSTFEPSGNGIQPDFEKLAFADYGHTVELGDYEASADSILYENDPTYRRKLNKDRQGSEKTFGASLRRLRLQRRLKQGDFPGITAKTIARIERNEVDNIQGKTLAAIATRLGVAVDQIASY